MMIEMVFVSVLYLFRYWFFFLLLLLLHADTNHNPVRQKNQSTRKFKRVTEPEGIRCSFALPLLHRRVRCHEVSSHHLRFLPCTQLRAGCHTSSRRRTHTSDAALRGRRAQAERIQLRRQGNRRGPFSAMPIIVREL